MALYNAEDRFNRRLKYPYVLFIAADEVDTFTPEVRAKIDYITEGRATFGLYIFPTDTRVMFMLGHATATVQPEAWGVPAGLNESFVEESLRKIGCVINFTAKSRRG